MDSPWEVSNCYPVCGLTGDHVYRYTGYQVCQPHDPDTPDLARGNDTAPAPLSLASFEYMWTGKRVALFRDAASTAGALAPSHAESHVGKGTGVPVNVEPSVFVVLLPAKAGGAVCQHTC